MRYTAPVIAGVLLSLIACDLDREVTVYSLHRDAPGVSHGREWLLSPPTTYRIGENEVVSSMGGHVHKYQNCAVFSRDDWECTFSDNSGSFGMASGSFWEHPADSDTRYVSWLAYNTVRCDEAITFEGRFWGTARCLLGWQ